MLHASVFFVHPKDLLEHFIRLVQVSDSLLGLSDTSFIKVESLNCTLVKTISEVKTGSSLARVKLQNSFENRLAMTVVFLSEISFRKVKTDF